MDTDDFNGLLTHSPDRDLELLEADVWRGVEARRAADRQALTVLKVQAGIAALAVTAAVTWGGMGAVSHAARADALSQAMALAPSTRLVGSPS
jgi:hypothetical protein